MELVRACLEQAHQGHGSVVLIEGEGGIGKSALLDWAAVAASRAELQVLRAGGRALEGEYAFGVVHQLLARHLADATPAERARLLEGAAAGAAELLEQTGTPGDAFPVINAVTWMIANAAEARPLALLVDDLYLADAPSLRLLAYLAERVEDMPVALVLATRPAEPGVAATVLPHLRSAGSTTRVHPTRLSESGVGWLIAELGYPGADPEFVRACAEVSGGNPFLLRELLYVLAEEAVESTAASVDRIHAIGPSAVAEAVYLALAGAGQVGTDLARSLAVAGPASPLSLVTALGRLEREDAHRAARLLVDAGVLADDGETLSFAHPILATAVYDDLGPLERGFAHAEAARLMHAAGMSGRRLAAQLLGAEVIGEGWALEVLRDAATGAMAGGDPESAARYLSRALSEPGAAESPELLLELAGAQRAAGNEHSQATFGQALAAAGDDLTASRVLLAQGGDLLARGDYAGAATVLRSGLDRCPPGETALLAELRSTWAGAAMWDPGQGVQAVAETAAILGAIEAPEGAAECIALANLTGAELMKGEDHARTLARARAAWGQGRALEALGPQDPALFGITAAFTAADALDECVELWTALIVEARRRGLLSAVATASYGRGNVEFMRGNLADALADTQFALDWQSRGWGLYACAAYWTLARIRLERGELDEAARGLEVGADREAELARGVDYMTLASARASVAVEQGRFADALALCERARESAAALGWEVHVFSWRYPAVRALVGLEQFHQAREVAREAVVHARRWGAPSHTAEALRTQARAEPDREIELLEQAVELLDGNERLLEAAHATAELGLALGRAGQVPGARVLLRRALDQAATLGATALVDRAREGLVATGARPRRTRISGRAALTPAELRVARLAAEGNTNREIAEALFVTIKAVKWHLSNIYRKLEIDARDKLAEALGP